MSGANEGHPDGISSLPERCACGLPYANGHGPFCLPSAPLGEPRCKWCNAPRDAHLVIEGDAYCNTADQPKNRTFAAGAPTPPTPSGIGELVREFGIKLVATNSSVAEIVAARAAVEAEYSRVVGIARELAGVELPPVAPRCPFHDTEDSGQCIKPAGHSGWHSVAPGAGEPDTLEDRARFIVSTLRAAVADGGSEPPEWFRFEFLEEVANTVEELVASPPAGRARGGTLQGEGSWLRWFVAEHDMDYPEQYRRYLQPGDVRHIRELSEKIDALSVADPLGEPETAPGDVELVSLFRDACEIWGADMQDRHLATVCELEEKLLARLSATRLSLAPKPETP